MMIFRSKILNCVVKEDGIRQISLSNIDGGSSGGPVLIPRFVCVLHASTDSERFGWYAFKVFVGAMMFVFV